MKNICSMLFLSLITLSIIGCGDDNNGLKTQNGASPELAALIKQTESAQSLFAKKAEEILKPHGIEVSMAFTNIEALDPAGPLSLKHLKNASAEFSLSLSDRSDIPMINDLKIYGMNSVSVNIVYESDGADNIVLKSSSSLSANMYNVVWLVSGKKLLPSDLNELQTFMQNSNKNKNLAFKLEGDAIYGSGDIAVGEVGIMSVKTKTKKDGMNMETVLKVQGLSSKVPMFASTAYLNAEQLFLTQLKSTDLKEMELELDRNMRQLIEGLKSEHL